jgi:hypothetical protein
MDVLPRRTALGPPGLPDEVLTSGLMRETVPLTA